MPHEHYKSGKQACLYQPIMTLLSHLYRALSFTSKAPASSATASSSSLAQQRHRGMTSVQEFVDAKIANNKIVVFSKTYCPYCAKTKQYFATKYPQEPVEVVELDIHDDGSAIQDYLKDMTGARSVPRTFINGSIVGGNDDLHNKSKAEVDALLAKRI